MANVRTILNLTPEALAVIEEHAPSQNKRGQWVSQAITEYARIMAGVGDLNCDDTTGILERIDSRMARMEKQMAVIVTAKG